MKKKLAIGMSLILMITNSVYFSNSRNTTQVQAATSKTLGYSAEDLVDMDELYGWASVSGEGIDGTTGGGNAEPQVVTTLEELTSLAAGNTPRVIVISGKITCGSYAVDVGSNKTIVGIDKNATIHGGLNMNGVSNIIISNLNFEGFWPNSGPDDCISARNTHHLWLNHLNVWNAGDGNMDLTMGSDYLTVSWCKFWYTDASHDHRLCSLVGSGTDHDDTDMGKLNATYHHNWFGELVDQRMPRILYGKGHVYNNYYTASGNGYCVGVGSYASVLIENNYFKSVNNPHQFMYDNALPAYITASGNIYDNTKGDKDTGLGGGENGYVVPFTDPPYYYDMDKAEDVPEIVQKGVGPQNVLTITPNPDKTPRPTMSAKPTPTPVGSYAPLPTAKPKATDNPLTYDSKTDTYTFHGSNKDGSNGFYTIENPFRGLKLSETPSFSGGYPVWKNGVTISYWVKMPSDAVDAAVLNFNLENNRQMSSADEVHYTLCQGYSAGNSAYSLGTSSTYVDASGKELTVLQGYGKNVCYNPEYPTAGYYALDATNGTIPVYKKGTDGTNQANWTFIKYIGKGQYEEYGKRFDEPGGQNSKIREAGINGSLSLYASGTVGYKQDNTTGLQMNPYLPEYGHVLPIQIYNQFYYWGNGSVYTLKNSSNLTPTMKTKDEWHFVVTVIQNDWIQYYMDGKEMTIDYLNWWGQAANNKYVAGRSFNLGYGMKKAYMTKSPAQMDTKGMTILDFICQNDTKLTVGGLGAGAAKLGQNTVGTPKGTQIIGLTFYDKPMSASNIKSDRIDTNVLPLAGYATKPGELPNTNPTSTPSPTPMPSTNPTPMPSTSPTQTPTASSTPTSSTSPTPMPSTSPTPKPTTIPTATPTMSPVQVKLGDVNGDNDVNLDDVTLALKGALTIITLEGNSLLAADIDRSGDVDLEDVQQILKAALLIIEL